MLPPLTVIHLISPPVDDATTGTGGGGGGGENTTMTEGFSTESVNLTGFEPGVCAWIVWSPNGSVIGSSGLISGTLSSFFPLPGPGMIGSVPAVGAGGGGSGA